MLLFLYIDKRKRGAFMIGIIIETKKEYYELLDIVLPNTYYIDVRLLRNDESISETFINTLNRNIQDRNPNTNFVREGRGNYFRIYRIASLNNGLKFLYNLNNFFDFEKTLMEQDDFKTGRTSYKLKPVFTEIGMSDIEFYDSKGETVCQVITHEGWIHINVEKYPSLKKFVQNNEDSNIVFY